MPTLIKHRVNTIAELQILPPKLGAEIDLRSHAKKIILSHDPYQPGDLLSTYLQLWSANQQRGTLVLNTKEDGLETDALVLLKKNGITDFFFLDLSLPTTVKLAARQKMEKVAVRVSEYEPPEAALKFATLAQWVWLDCFSPRPPQAEVIATLRGKFKICLVSPELQSHPPGLLPEFLKLAAQVDAICTKAPHSWQGS